MKYPRKVGYKPHSLDRILHELPTINQDGLKKLGGWSYYRRTQLADALFSREYLANEAMDGPSSTLIKEAELDTAKWYRQNVDLMRAFEKRRAKERKLENDPPIHCDHCKPLGMDGDVEILPAYWRIPEWLESRRKLGIPDPPEPFNFDRFDSYGQYVVWCRYCEKWHLHGPGDSPKMGTGNGHRSPHCHYSGSMYHEGGYSLKFVGEITKAISQRHKENQGRKSNADGESNSWVRFDGHWYLWRTIFSSTDYRLNQTLTDDDFSDQRDFLTEYAKRHIIYFGREFKPKGGSGL